MRNLITRVLVLFVLMLGCAHAGSLPDNCTATYTTSSAFNGSLGAAPISLTCSATSQPQQPPVNPPVATPPVNPGACSASQTSQPFGLQRLCAGTVGYPGNTCRTCKAFYGALTDGATLLAGGSWGSFASQGFPFTIVLPHGTYAAFAFTPTAGKSLQFGANGTFGDGGTISLSKTPGLLTIAAGAICAQGRNGSNNLIIYPIAGQQCSVTPGQTYYVNFADVDASGAPAGPGPVAYTAY